MSKNKTDILKFSNKCLDSYTLSQFLHFDQYVKKLVLNEVFPDQEQQIKHFSLLSEAIISNSTLTELQITGSPINLSALKHLVNSSFFS